MFFDTEKTNNDTALGPQMFSNMCLFLRIPLKFEMTILRVS